MYLSYTTCSPSLIFPSALANDGLYRETRHFTAWTKERQIEDCKLHAVIREVTGQSTAPIGDMIFETHDTSIAHETCEEMVGPASIKTASQLGWLTDH